MLFKISCSTTFVYRLNFCSYFSVVGASSSNLYGHTELPPVSESKQNMLDFGNSQTTLTTPLPSKQVEDTEFNEHALEPELSFDNPMCNTSHVSLNHKRPASGLSVISKQGIATSHVGRRFSVEGTLSSIKD